MAVSASHVPFTSTMILTSGPTASRTAMTLAVASLSETYMALPRILRAVWPCFTYPAAFSASLSGGR